MKLMKCISAGVLTACMTVSSSFAAVDNSITFTVNEDNEFRDVTMEMYGVGSEWLPSNSAYITNYAEGSGINRKFVSDMKEQGLSFEHFRMAGVTSTGYMWKENLGNISERKSYSIGTGNAVQMKSAFGVLELAKLADAFNPGKGTVAYTVNLLHESPESMADLAEYFYGDGKKNYNGGINWAQKRIAGGMVNPVNVAEWEMGNEYDFGIFSHMFINYKIYIQKCKEVIAAIRSVKPDAPIALTGDLMEGIKSNWDNAMLNELGNEVQYYVKHGYFAMDAAYANEMNFVETGEVLDKKFGKNKIGIVVTEYNAQGTLSVMEGSDAVAGGMGGCMYFAGGRAVADYLLRRIRQENILKANIFATNAGTSYSMYYLDTDGKYKLNAAAMTLAMFQKYGVGKAYESSVTDFDIGTASKISGAAIKTDDGMNLIMVNNSDDTDYYINFDFKKKYTVVEKEVMLPTEGGKLASNYKGKKQIDKVNEKFDDGKAADGYLVPKMTIMALRLKEVQ